MYSETGLTAVEAMVAIAIVAILAAIGVPAYSTWQTSQRLQGVSHEYRTDLQWARSLAVKTNTTVHLNFGPGCYAIYTGDADACQCSNSPVCQGGAELLKSVQLGTGGVTLQKVGSGNTSHIEAQHGIFAPTFSVNLVASNGTTLRHISNIMGRTRVCMVGSTGLGYPKC